MVERPVKAVSPTDVSIWIKSGKKNYLIVDVRDYDYAGRKIKGSIHIPSEILVIGLTKLIGDLEKMNPKPENIVFYCMNWYRFLFFEFFLTFFRFFSEDRGPTAARTFSFQIKNKYPNLNIYFLEGGWVKWRESYEDDKELVCFYSYTLTNINF